MVLYMNRGIVQQPTIMTLFGELKMRKPTLMLRAEVCRLEVLKLVAEVWIFLALMLGAEVCVYLY